MSRAVSIPALQGVLAQETDEVYLECITITHSDLAAPIYLVNDVVDLPRTAATFKAWPFTMQFPDDDDAQVPSITFNFDAVDQTVAEQILGLNYPMPQFTYEVVLASSPNTVEAGPFEFDCLNVQINALTGQAGLGFEEDLLNEPFPGDLCTPSNAPGLFQ